MYWPGITDDIKHSISGCKACLTFATQQQREPYAADAQVKPWTLLSLDNFEFQSQYFIMVLDMATKFFVVRPVHSLNTDVTIQILTSIFSEHGMPVAIRCDRGCNFMSDLFQQYCSHLVSDYHTQVRIITVPIWQKGQLGLLKYYEKMH